MAKDNPIIETYKGVQIRENNRFVLRMGPVLFKLLILESERTGMPISKILAYSSTPCEKCVSIPVITFNRDDDMVKIKRGILSQHIPEGNGTSIIKQAHAKKH